MLSTQNNVYGGLGLSADNAGTTSTYDTIAIPTSYQGLANYAVGDVVSGTRADGTTETYLVSWGCHRHWWIL